MQNLRGPNPKDILADKAAKLVQQLNLLHTPQGRETLTMQALPDSSVSASVVRDVGFFPHGFDVFEPLFNLYGWRGIYIRSWAEYRSECTEACYHLFDRVTYLAPAQVTETDTLNGAEIRRIDNNLITVLELRPDGF